MALGPQWAPQSLQRPGLGHRAKQVRSNKGPCFGWLQAQVPSGQHARPWALLAFLDKLSFPGLFPCHIALL